MTLLNTHLPYMIIVPYSVTTWNTTHMTHKMFIKKARTSLHKRRKTYYKME